MVFVSFIILNVFFGVVIFLYNKLTCGYCRCSKHLVGKVVIVTGANAGIGYETAKDLAERGARVILACRNEERGTTARDNIVALTGNTDVHYKHLDLTSFYSVRKFADEILKNETRLDVLINNAAVYGSENVKTIDGLLLGMQTNYFSPFLLTSLLLPLLKITAPSRIINLSSSVHVTAQIDLDNLNMEKETEKTFNPHEVYRVSKLCNVLTTVEFTRRYDGTGVTANAVQPGAVYTDIYKQIPIVKYLVHFIRLFQKSTWQGAQTSIYLAVSPEVENVSGHYYNDCHKGTISKLAQDSELTRKLWDLSEKIVKLKIE